MGKNEFIRQLDRMLSQLPDVERKKHTDYYGELIDDMVEAGMSEAEAVAKLGDPRTIADDILTETPLPLLVKTKVRPSGGWTALTIILAILSFPIWFPIFIALFAVLISVFAVLWSIVIAFVAVVVSLIVSGIAILIAAPITVSVPAVTLIMAGAAFMMIGVGILLCFGVYWACVGVVGLTKLIAKCIKSLFIRKGV